MRKICIVSKAELGGYLSFELTAGLISSGIYWNQRTVSFRVFSNKKSESKNHWIRLFQNQERMLSTKELEKNGYLQNLKPNFLQ
jgi:hypothetical protein